jgi:hypothetical protein
MSEHLIKLFELRMKLYRLEAEARSISSELETMGSLTDISILMEREQR